MQDATFEMERRRNRPEKYDREPVHKTVNAIKKVTDVRHKRQDRCGLAVWAHKQHSPGRVLTIRIALVPHMN